MRDGKALQMATSHELGQNFARAFDIAFTTREGSRELCWTTSWGSTTRMIGGLIMCHGDDAGLRLPPVVAPIQAIVIAAKDDPGTLEAVASVAQALASEGLRTRIDDRGDLGLGRRITDWELKGVPVRIEIGPRDLADDAAMVVRRDTGARESVPLTRLGEEVTNILAEIQASLAREAMEYTQRHLHDVTTLDDAREAARRQGLPGSPGPSSASTGSGSSTRTRFQCAASRRKLAKSRLPPTRPISSRSSGARTDSTMGSPRASAQFATRATTRELGLNLEPALVGA